MRGLDRHSRISVALRIPAGVAVGSQAGGESSETTVLRGKTRRSHARVDCRRRCGGRLERTHADGEGGSKAAAFARGAGHVRVPSSRAAYFFAAAFLAAGFLAAAFFGAAAFFAAGFAAALAAGFAAAFFGAAAFFAAGLAAAFFGAAAFFAAGFAAAFFGAAAFFAAGFFAGFVSAISSLPVAMDW